MTILPSHHNNIISSPYLNLGLFLLVELLIAGGGKFSAPSASAPMPPTRFASRDALALVLVVGLSSGSGVAISLPPAPLPTPAGDGESMLDA